MGTRFGGDAVRIDRLEVSAYTVPTDFPESDGTYAWKHTTLVLVEATAGGKTGLGYSYADTATAALIRDSLAEVVRGRDAMAVPGAWAAMVAAIRNLGRPGIASMAISAVDAALWDLKARLLDLPLVDAPGRRPRRRAGLRQRRVHVVLDRAAPRPARRLGRAGHPARQDEDRHPPGRRPRPRPGRPRGDRAGRRAVRRRQRRLQPQAGAGAGRGVRRAGRDAGSRSRSPPTTSRGCACSATAPRPAWTSPPASTATTCSTSAGCSTPARWTCSRPTPPAAAGITGFLQRRPRSARRDALPLSAHCAPSLHAHPCCAVPAAAPPGVLPRPRPHRAHAVRRRARARSAGRCARTCRGPAWGSNSSARTPRASPSERTAGHPAHERKGSTTMATADRDLGSTVTEPRTATPVPRTRNAVRLRRRRRAGGRAARRKIRGEVRFDAGSRALYATDGSNYRQVPIGVVVPRDVDDVIATVAACRALRRAAPLARRRHQPRRQCCNVAVVMDFSKYLHRVLGVDPDRKLARVQPGCVLDDLRGAAEKHDLTFGPDPATHNHCTLGGMIGNNSCGVHSLMGLGTGRTADNVDELEILTYDGARMRVGADQRGRARADHPRPAAARARSTPGSRRSATATPTLIRARFPKTPAPRLRLQPRRPAAGERLPRRAGAGRHGGHAASPSSRRRCTSCPARRRARSSCSATPTSTTPATTSPRSCEFEPIGLEGLDDLPRRAT